MQNDLVEDTSVSDPTLCKEAGHMVAWPAFDATFMEDGPAPRDDVSSSPGAALLPAAFQSVGASTLRTSGADGATAVAFASTGGDNCVDDQNEATRLSAVRHMSSRQKSQFKSVLCRNFVRTARGCAFRLADHCVQPTLGTAAKKQIQ